METEQEVGNLGDGYLTVLAFDDDQSQLALADGSVSVLLVGQPDAAGDGSRHLGVLVGVAGVRQQGAFSVQ